MAAVSKRMYKFYAFCPECRRVMIFKKRGAYWEDGVGHEYEWARDAIQDEKEYRRNKHGQ
jgi:hypothetical protein